MEAEYGQKVTQEEVFFRKQSEVTFEMQMLAHSMKRYLDSLVEADKMPVPDAGKGLSGTNMFIMGYLFENRDREVYQKELEERMNVRRSTISKVLRIMEKKGLICRQQAEHDARVKQITLSVQSLHNLEMFRENMEKMQRRLTEGFTEEELEQFLYLIRKAKKNFE